MINDRKIYISILMIISISVFSGIVSGIDNQSVRSQNIYKSFIDTSGFYKVLNTTYNKLEPSENKTLYIYKGDAVVWVNDEPSGKRFTIVSEQKLWKNDTGILGGRDEQFEYIFNRTGRYTFYIKEHPELQHQKIIVEKNTYKTNSSKTNSSKTNSSKTSKTNKKTDISKNIKTKTVKIEPTPKIATLSDIGIILTISVLLLAFFLVYRKKEKE